MRRATASRSAGTGGDVQDVAKRQDAALVRGRVTHLEDDADDGLRAQRHGDQRARNDRGGELARDLVVEGLGEGPGADEREDGGVRHATAGRSGAPGVAAPPSSRRRLRP